MLLHPFLVFPAVVFGGFAASSKQRGLVVRVAFFAAMSYLLLPLPFAYLEPGLVSTMATTVFVFLLWSKTTALLLFPSLDERGTVVDAPDESMADTLRRLCRWLMALTFLPIVQTPTAVSRLGLVGEAAEIGMRLAGKTAVSAVLAELLPELVLGRGALGDATTLALWVATLALAPVSEVPELVVLVLSGGRWRVDSFNDWFVWSSSLHELWSRRYNSTMRHFFRATVFAPLRECGVRAGPAAMAVFVLSGVLHAYVAAAVFGRGQAGAFVFFVLAGAATAFERAAERWWVFSQRPRIVGWLLTLGVLYWLAPLYPALFVEAWRATPSWLVRNKPVAPGYAVRLAAGAMAFLDGRIGVAALAQQVVAGVLGSASA